MAWTVHILNETVEQAINEWSVNDRARLEKIVGMIEEFGLTAVGEPHVKHLEDKLWEMRPGSGRAVYVAATGERVVIVHAFVKKTQKTPKKELKTARQRAKEVE